MKKKVVIPTMVCATTLAVPVLHAQQYAIGGGLYMTVSPGPDSYGEYQPLDNGGQQLQQMAQQTVNGVIVDGASATVLVVGAIDGADEVVGILELGADAMESGYLKATATWIADKLESIIPDAVQKAVEEKLKELIKDYDDTYNANYGIAYGYGGNYYYPPGYGYGC